MRRLLLLLAILRSVSGVCQNGGRRYPSASWLDCKQKQFIVDLHNELREKVASGKVPTQPQAADMIELRWSPRAARKAQEWADKCLFEHSPDLELNGTPLGQNIALMSITRDRYRNPNLTHLIYQWFNEVYEYGFDGETFGNAGHYTQMIWGKTKYVGCGITYYFKDGWYNSYLVCNYFPAGNYIGQKVYTYGETDCTAHRLVPSKTYGHLCALNSKDSKVCPMNQRTLSG